MSIEDLRIILLTFEYNLLYIQDFEINAGLKHVQYRLRNNISCFVSFSSMQCDSH